MTTDLSGRENPKGLSLLSWEVLRAAGWLGHPGAGELGSWKGLSSRQG